MRVPLTRPAIKASEHIVSALETCPECVMMRLPRMSMGLEVTEEIVASQRSIAMLQWGQKVVLACSETP
jgi:hypothetical protein